MCAFANELCIYNSSIDGYFCEKTTDITDTVNSSDTIKIIIFGLAGLLIIAIFLQFNHDRKNFLTNIIKSIK